MPNSNDTVSTSHSAIAFSHTVAVMSADYFGVCSRRKNPVACACILFMS